MLGTLDAPQTRSTLDRLHAEARGDFWKLLPRIPLYMLGRMRGKTMSEMAAGGAMDNVFIPVDPDQGRMLYLLARAVGARTIVEFGTSFGISTIYLAAAVKDNGGGIVIGTELSESKHAAAQRHLEEAGLADCVEVRLGDALETLKHLPESVDLLLLDGWKDLYLPVLDLVKPRLRPGALVLADNVHRFKSELRPFAEYMQGGDSGFLSTTLDISDGFEFAVYQPGDSG